MSDRSEHSPNQGSRALPKNHVLNQTNSLTQDFQRSVDSVDSIGDQSADHGHRTRAHVAISRLAHGVEPDGMLVVNCPHSRLCVNPDHLHWSANGIPYETIVCIRLLYGIYPNHILARAVGLTSTTVCRIANRKVYGNVPSPAKRFNLEHWRNVVRMEGAACRS